MKKRVIDPEGLLEGTVDTEVIINTIEKTIDKFSDVAENESSDVAKKREDLNSITEEFFSEIEKWQVVLMNPNGTKIWMQAPMSYYETSRNTTMMERIKIFFNSGVIMGKRMIERYADVEFNMKYPIELTLEPIHGLIAKMDENMKLYYTLITVVSDLKKVIREHEEGRVSIYEKPYGIVAMNSSKYYMSEMGKMTGLELGHIQSSIETISFKELIKESVVEFEMDEQNKLKLDFVREDSI